MDPEKALFIIARLPQLNGRVSDWHSRDSGRFAGPTEAVDMVENESV